MTLNDLMKDIVPNPDYEGFVNASDMVLAVDFSDDREAEPDTYLVAQQGVTGHPGTLNVTTVSREYIRSGATEIKTGASFTVDLGGDRYIGDPFQDALLSHKNVYGVGSAIIYPAVHFNLLTGKGTKMKMSIVVNENSSGEAGDLSGYTATLTSTETPTEYEYERTSP